MLTISAASEIRKVELDLVPPLIQSHRHRANERLHARCRLEVRKRVSESVSRNHGAAFNAHIRGVMMTRVKKMYFTPPHLFAPDSWMRGSGGGRSCRPTPGSEGKKNKEKVSHEYAGLERKRPVWVLHVARGQTPP